MMSSAVASQIASEVRNGDNPSVVPSTVRLGNEMLDEINMAVAFAAMKGLNTTYLNISKYPLTTINGVVATLEGLGYTVDRERERYYKEIVVVWPT